MWVWLRHQPAAFLFRNICDIFSANSFNILFFIQQLHQYQSWRRRSCCAIAPTTRSLRAKVRAVVPNDRVARALSSRRAVHYARTCGAHTGQLQSRGARARVSTTRRPVARQESHFGFVFVVRFFSLTLAFLSLAAQSALNLTNQLKKSPTTRCIQPHSSTSAAALPVVSTSSPKCAANSPQTTSKRAKICSDRHEKT